MCLVDLPFFNFVWNFRPYIQIYFLFPLFDWHIHIPHWSIQLLFYLVCLFIFIQTPTQKITYFASFDFRPVTNSSIRNNQIRSLLISLCLTQFKFQGVYKYKWAPSRWSKNTFLSTSLLTYYSFVCLQTGAWVADPNGVAKCDRNKLRVKK